MSESPAADVVVAGAGLAGLQCAVTIGELAPGAEVVLLESQDATGGSARWAVGSFTAGGTRWQAAAGVTDSPEEHYRDALTMCQLRHPDYRELLLAVCRRGPGLLADLAGLGIQFAGPYQESPHRQPRMHNAVPAANAVTELLAGRAAGLGVTILTGCALTGLRPAAGGGYDLDAGGRRFRTRQVIIASGDASAAHPVFPAVNPGATGTASRLAAASLGAALEDAPLVPWLRTLAAGRPRVSPTASIVRAATVRAAGRELSGAQLLADPSLAGGQPLELVITADEAACARTIACTYPASGYATIGDLVADGLARRENADTVVVGPLGMVITLADGGLVTDTGLRVQHRNGGPLPGLRACGSAALGGITLGGHGHHLLWAAATGELAGQQAAAELRRPRRPLAVSGGHRWQ